MSDESKDVSQHYTLGDLEQRIVSALAEYDDGSGSALFAGGSFTTAGGVLSTYLGKWSCPNPLFADGFESGDTTAWSATVP